MPIDRAGGRNVHFYNAMAPHHPLGGLIQNGSVTEENFLDMLGIILITDIAFSIQVQERDSGHYVTRTNNPLQLGHYNVYSDGDIAVTDELWVQRVHSCYISGRDTNFRAGIRARDGGCVVSGVRNVAAHLNNWTRFEAAHIFPFGQEELWIKEGYGRWITDMDNITGVDISKISSCQNGFLLQASYHKEFDQYQWSVNPDDSYKIVVFTMDLDGMDGRILDPVCRNPQDPHRVPDELLRWHFRQSVLANMRGRGEPIFECDFPPGTDMVKEISEGPRAKERFELELRARLGWGG